MEVEPSILPLHGAVQVKGIAQPIVGRASGGGEGRGGAREGGRGGNRYAIDTRLSLPSTRPRTSSVLIPN